jgi:hypothetical protein
MSDPTFDHAAAHEWIADLALVPGSIDAALASPAAENRALVEHVAGCERCQADVVAWRAVQRTVGGALRTDSPGGRPDVEPIDAGPSLRRAVLASVRAGERATGAAAMAERPRPVASRVGGFQLPAPRVPSLLLGLAAALLVAIGGTVLLAGPGLQLMQQVGEAHALTGVVAAVDRILSDAEHRTVSLHDPAGRAAGTISWSSRDLVVLTAAIKPAAPGQVYRCWLSGSGRDTAIGRMEFAAGTAYWVGSLDEWASISLSPGTAFYVTLEDAAAGPSPAGPVVLEGEL